MTQHSAQADSGKCQEQNESYRNISALQGRALRSLLSREALSSAPRGNRVRKHRAAASEFPGLCAGEASRAWQKGKRAHLALCENKACLESLITAQCSTRAGAGSLWSPTSSSGRQNSSSGHLWQCQGSPCQSGFRHWLALCEEGLQRTSSSPGRSGGHQWLWHISISAVANP